VNISITSTEFMYNFAKQYGGGMCLEENVRKLRVEECTFIGNFVWGIGGGAYFGMYDTTNMLFVYHTLTIAIILVLSYQAMFYIVITIFCSL
jgi:hypothetical protein